VCYALSLYSQQSCSFVVTPVLVTRNASKLVIIGLNKYIVDYSRSACKFWKVQTTTVEDLEGASWLPLALGRRTDAVTHGTPTCDSGTAGLLWRHQCKCEVRSNFKLSRSPSKQNRSVLHIISSVNNCVLQLYK